MDYTLSNAACQPGNYDCLTPSTHNKANCDNSRDCQEHKRMGELVLITWTGVERS